MSLVVASAGLLGVAPARAISTASLNVKPGNGIVAGQWVEASWAGVDPGTPVYLRQCQLNPLSIRDCGYLGSNALHSGGIASASGEGSIFFPVSGVLNGDSVLDRFECDSLHACAIALFTDPTATNLNQAAFDPISFGVSSETCAQPLSSSVVVAGQGTSAVARAFRGWEGRLCGSPNFLHVVFHVTSSPAGEAAFVGGKAAFAMTSQPLSHTSIVTLSDQHRRYAYAPMVGSGLAFGFRMVDPVSGLPITTLQLTPSQIAQIFTGQLQDLNSDPDIVAQNPGITFPPVVQAIGRGDASAQTRLLTSWFLSVARHSYRLGGSAFASGGATDTYPHSATISLLSSAKSVATAVGRPDLPPSQFGTIGWMDSSVAVMYDLPTVMVQNHAGEFVGPTSTSIGAAIRDMGVSADGVTRFPRFTTSDAKAYPLPVVTYMVAQTSVTAAFDKTEADVLRTFIRFAASRNRPGLAVAQLGGQTNLPDGYASLPNDMTNDALRAADLLPTTSYVAPTTPPPGAGGTTPPPALLGGGGVVQPSGSGSTATPTFGTGTPVATPGGVLPTGVLPPSTLSSAGTGYVWSIVLTIGALLFVLGSMLSLALRLASYRGARKALATAGAAAPGPGDAGGDA